jgi:hypothetical protein
MPETGFYQLVRTGEEIEKNEKTLGKEYGFL